MEIKSMTRDQATKALKEQGRRTYIVRKEADGQIVVSTRDFNGRIAHTLFAKQQNSDSFVVKPRFMGALPEMLKNVPPVASSSEALLETLDRHLGPSLYAPRGQTFFFGEAVPGGAPRPSPPKSPQIDNASGNHALDVMRARAARIRSVGTRTDEATNTSAASQNFASRRANRERHYGAPSVVPIAAKAAHSTDLTGIYGNESGVPDYRAVYHDIEMTSGAVMVNLMNTARLQPSQIKDRLVENADGTVTVLGLFHPFTGEPLPDQRVNLEDPASKKILWSQHVAIQNPENAGNQTWAAIIYVAAANNFAAALAEHGLAHERSNEKLTLANVASQKSIDLMLHGRVSVDVPLATQPERAAAERYIQDRLNANVPLSVSLAAEHQDFDKIRNFAVVGMVKNLSGRVFVELCAAHNGGKDMFSMSLDDFTRYGAVLSHL
jgi:hypothetical protein